MKNTLITFLLSMLSVSGYCQAIGLNIITDTLTSAQLQGLNSSPVIGVPAQGPGTKILPIAAAIYYTYNAVPYNNQQIYLTEDPSTNVYWFMGAANVLSGTASINQSFVKSAPNSLGGSMKDNTPLYIWAPNSTGASGDGTAVIKIIYAILN